MKLYGLVLLLLGARISFAFTIPTPPTFNRDRSERSSTMKSIRNDLAPVVLVTPAFLAMASFASYKQTSESFHAFVQFASHNSFAPVDGGAYLSDLITPALNGPVTTSISILFGTLTSMTLSNLYSRQQSMDASFSRLIDECRIAQLHVEDFPDSFRAQAEHLLDSFLRGLFEAASSGELSPETLRAQTEMSSLIRVFNQLSKSEEEYSPVVLTQAYSAVNKVIDHRADLISTFNKTFPRWHYGNLGLLALAICLIFLTETDKTALLFLGGFQLRMCWSMLIGTFSLLATVIYDLNTPLSGVFEIVSKANMNPVTFRDYHNIGDNRF